MHADKYAVACLLLISAMYGEEPLLFFNDSSETSRRVIMVDYIPDTLAGLLQDFMPQEAAASYSINFCDFIPVRDIGPFGDFTISKPASGPWLIEGINTVTFYSRNRAGLSNRQTSIFQVFTTGPMVQILWPPCDAAIRDTRPQIRARAGGIYDSTTRFLPRNFRLQINGISASAESCALDSTVYSCRPDWARFQSADSTDATSRISLEVSGTSIDAGSETKSYTVYWAYELDTTAPIIRLYGDSVANPSKDSTYLLRMDLSDNHSQELKDIRITLFKEKADGTWESVPSSGKILPFASCGTHTIKVPLATSSFFLFKSIQEGRYRIIVRARDAAFLNEEHFQSSHPSFELFNHASDTLELRLDAGPPELGKVSVSHKTYTSFFQKKGDRLIVRYRLSEQAKVRFRFLLLKGPNTIEIFSKTVSKAPGKAELTMDFDSLPSLLPDGDYRVELSAEDGAGNRSDTSSTPVFRIDRTAPVCRDLAVSSLVINGSKAPLPSGENANMRSASWISLSFSAYDLFGAETLALRPENISCSILSPDGLSAPFLKRAHTVDGRRFSLDSIPKECFDRGAGVYRVRVVLNDNNAFPNVTEVAEPVINGCIPPEITGPSAFSEIAGIVVLKGVAKDPDWTDGVRFSHYELEYRRVLPDSATGSWVPESPDWEIDGLSVPASNRSSDFPFSNVSGAPVSHGDVLGYWNTASGTAPKQGYYQVRLSVFDRNFHEEMGDNPLDDASNAGRWAADTSVFYVYNDTGLSLSGAPIIKALSLSGARLDFKNNNPASFSFDLQDVSGKRYDVALEIRGKDGALVADSQYAAICPDLSAWGRPSSLARLGFFVFQDNEGWHVNWNTAGTPRTFSGTIQFTGPFSGLGPLDAVTFSKNGLAPDGLSVISFNSDKTAGFLFNAEAPNISFQLSMTSPENQPWIFKGRERLPVRSTVFRLQGKSAQRPFAWNGVTRFGFYPPPGEYSLCARAVGTNGLGYAEDMRTLYLDFPFGIRIDSLSDTLFELDTTTDYREVSLFFRPFSRSAVSCFLLSEKGVLKPLFMDSVFEGRGPKAGACCFDWNLNFDRNRLADPGRYRFVVRASPPGDPGLSCCDTSGRFRLRFINTRQDSAFAGLDIRGDTSIVSNGRSFPVINGKSDYRWMAKGIGRSFPDIPFTFTTTLSGKQTVVPRGFQRFTVKARRGFKKLTYKVRIWLDCSWYLRSTLVMDRSPSTGSHQYTEKDKFFTHKNPENLSFSDTWKGENSHQMIFSAHARIIDGAKRNHTFYHGGQQVVDLENSNIFTGDVKFKKNDYKVGEPTLWVFFLKNNFDGPETPETWKSRAVECLSLNYDDISPDSEYFALPVETIWQCDSSILSDADFKNLLKFHPEDSAKYTPYKGTNYSQFWVKIHKRIRDRSDSWKEFYKVTYSLSFGTRREIWDTAYTRHGFNSLVNRYATWDSENSVFFNHGKGIVAKDSICNSMDSISVGATPEDEVRFVSSHHVQAFDFKFLLNPGGPYTPFYFYGLEDQNPSLSGPFWEFKLEDMLDANTYERMEWAACTSKGKDVGRRADYHRIPRARRFRIEGDAGPRGLMVWCSGASNSVNARTIDWPLTPGRLDTINKSDTGLLNGLPPGCGSGQKFIPYFGAHVRFGLNDGFDANHDGTIDAAYESPVPESLAVILERLKRPLKTDTSVRQGMITLHPDGRYCHEFLIDRDILACGSNVTPFGRIENYDSPPSAPLTFREETGNDSIPRIVFKPLTYGQSWSTLSDPFLVKEGKEAFDSIDNDKDLEIDENVSGYLSSPPVPFNPAGFASQNIISFGYRKPKVTVDKWEVSLRRINGAPNADLKVSSLSGNAFTVRLKDNVFVPKRLVEVRGVCRGETYRLLARNGNGWRAIGPVIDDPVQNRFSTASRTLAYWDISDLCGSTTLLLQVRRGGKIYQALQHLFIGQPVSGSAAKTVYSTHSRSRLDLQEGSLSSWPDTAMVSLTARSLEELKLQQTPNLSPVGPVMEILPSPVSFPPAKRPKLTVTFTYNEVKLNNWLNGNFNLYTLNKRGEMDIVENSVTTYHRTDSTGAKTLMLRDQSAFRQYGDSTHGLALMQVSAELDHWSDFIVVKRRPRTHFLDPSAPPGGNGRSWSSAFSCLDSAMKYSLSGDSLRISRGLVHASAAVNKDLVLLGGFIAGGKTAQPAVNRTILTGRFSFSANCRASGLVFKGPCSTDSALVVFSHCLFLNEVSGFGPESRFFRCTFGNSVISSGPRGGPEISYSLLQKTRLSSTTELKGCALSGDPDLNDDYTLQRTSALIDACPVGVEKEFYGWGPDIGFHEFTGDTFYISEKRGSHENAGKSPSRPFRDLESAFRAAQSNDLILAAEGAYSCGLVRAKPVFLSGGYSGDFRSRNPLRHLTAVHGNLGFQAQGVISGLRFDSVLRLEGGRHRIDSCWFKGAGAGIALASGSTADVSHSVFADNRTAIAAAGNARLDVSRSTFARNFLGIHCDSIGIVSLNNSVFFKSGTDIICANGTTRSYNLTFQSENPLPPGAGATLSTDPLFSGPETDDFFLKPGSPCLYRGENRGLIGALGRKPSLDRAAGTPDTSSPHIRISGIRRFSTDIVAPLVEFLNVAPEDPRYILVNDAPLPPEGRFYREGDYVLKCGIRCGDAVLDTSVAFTIDMTPPWISISGTMPVVHVKDKHLKKAKASLNSRPYPLTGERISRQGSYRLRVMAEDSAGNTSEKEVKFRITRAEQELDIVLVSHEGVGYSNQTETTIEGFVNSNAVDILVNGDTVRQARLFRDSTAFSCQVALPFRENHFNFQAFSRIASHSAQKEITIFKDTVRPAIVIHTPLPGSRHESPVSIREIAVSGAIRSSGPLKSVQVLTPPKTTAASFTWNNGIALFSASASVFGEAANYPITVKAVDAYGNFSSSLIVVTVGSRPVILHESPPHLTAVNTSSATLMGRIVDKNLRTLSIQNVPISFLKEADTSFYGHILALPAEGANRIVLKAEDSLGFADSLAIIIGRDQTPPSISITSPEDGLITQDSVLSIRGVSGDPYAFIRAGEASALYPPGASFLIPEYGLAPGTNLITVECADTAGNSGLPVTLRVTRLDAGTLFLDASHTGPEDGTERHPFKTLAHALAASKEGTHLLVKDGSYNEAGTFPRGVHVSGMGTGAVFNCGNGSYTVEGDASFNGIIFKGKGTTVLSASNGKYFSMAECSFSSSGNGISISAYDTVILSGCRLDSCGLAGAHLADIGRFTARNLLFTRNGGAGLMLTRAFGMVLFSTFSGNLAGISASGGSLIIKNSIFHRNTGWAVSQSGSPGISVTYCDFYGNGLGVSQDASSILFPTNIITNPSFSSETDFRLTSASPAKTAGEYGAEMGFYGPGAAGKTASAAVILSPPNHVHVSGAVPIVMNKSRFQPGYSLPEVLVNGQWRSLARPDDGQPDNVWAVFKTSEFNDKDCVIRAAGRIITVRTGLPVRVKEAPLTTTPSVGRKTASNGTLVFSLDRHTLRCKDNYGSLLYSFEGFGKDTYKFDSPDSLFLTESTLVVADRGNNRLMAYKVYPDAPDVQEIQEGPEPGTALSMKDVHFIPSPFIPKKTKGYFRYRLSRDAEVDISAFDRAGLIVRRWHFESGYLGGRAGVNEIPWDGRNGAGVPVSTGSYVFRVSARSAKQTARAQVKMGVIAIK